MENSGPYMYTMPMTTGHRHLNGVNTMAKRETKTQKDNTMNDKTDTANTETSTATTGTEQKAPATVTIPEDCPKLVEGNLVRVKQNGVMRPFSGTPQGLIWDIADYRSNQLQAPALVGEVREFVEPQLMPHAEAFGGEQKVKDMISTQYSGWVQFHGVKELVAARRGTVVGGKTPEEQIKAAEEAKAKAEETARKAQERAAKADEQITRAKALADAAAKAVADANAA
jgi:hypothetical protein